MAEKLVPYQRTIRPVLGDSLPKWVEQELDRIGVITKNIIQAIEELDARVTALE